MTLTEAKSLLVKPQSGVYLTAAEVEEILSAMEGDLEVRTAAQDWQRRAERAERIIAALRYSLDDPPSAAETAYGGLGSEGFAARVNERFDSPSPASAPADPLPPSKGVVLGEGALLRSAEDVRRLCEQEGVASLPALTVGFGNEAQDAARLAETYPQYMERIFRSEDARAEESGAGRDASSGTTANGSHEAAGPTPLGVPVAKPVLEQVAAPLPAKPPRKRKAPAPISTAIQCGGPDCTLSGNVEHHKPCRYTEKPRVVPLRPWHDAPNTPCGCGPIGSLTPFNPGGWYGPKTATLFCPACGKGWVAADSEIEQALIAESWWDAYERGHMTEHDFAANEGGC